MQITLNESKKFIKKCLKAGVVPYLHSSPAIGKSSMYHQIAAEYNLFVIDWRGAGADPTDLNGYPDLAGEYATYKPFDTFPTTKSVIPKGYAGWLLLMDEFSSAPRSVQAPAYKLILDKKVGTHDLHEKVFICAAGNLDTDNAITHPMSTALVSRMAHLYIRPDLDAWIDWAAGAGIHATKMAFMEFKRDCFYNFNPETPKDMYASPRTWEMVDKIEKKSGLSTMEDLPLLSGLIGKGAAAEYLAFLSIAADAPSIAKIIAAPLTEPVPKRQDIRYALVGSLAEAFTEDNCTALCQFLARMPTEFRLLAVRTAYKRNKPLLDNDDFGALVDEYAKYLKK